MFHLVLSGDNPLPIDVEKIVVDLSTMSSDEENYAVGGKAAIDEPLKKDNEKPLSAKDLEPFGNEETAEVKYRTMKWW